MPSPKVSVLLPVRNGDPYFAAALDSILSQEGVTFEVIVIDDGSSDGTVDLLADCQDRRLRVIRRDGGGLVAALNAGLAAARGEYCARMDADDIALPGRLAAQAAVLDGDHEAVLVHGAVELIDEAGRAFGMIAAPQLDRAGRKAILLSETEGPPIIHPAVMLRRSALIGAGGYRAIPSCEDHDLWLRLIDRGRFVAMPQQVLRYRQHAKGISRERMAEQALSNIVNCVVARWRAETGIDVMAAQPELHQALRAEAGQAASGYLRGFVASRRLRMALRRGHLLQAVVAGLRLLATGGVVLLSGSGQRRGHRRLQQRLLAWLRQQATVKNIATDVRSTH